MIPADTSEDAYRAQLEAYRRMGGAARCQVMWGLIALAREATVAGIRRRHPEYTSEQVNLAFARLRLGEELVKAAWANKPLVQP